MASYSSLQVTIFLCIFLLSANANEVTVGGETGDWKIPSSSSFSFNEWADKSRFLLGDFLGITSIPHFFLYINHRYNSVSDIVTCCCYSSIQLRTR